VPNAALLIPASSTRPPLAKTEYQTATPEGSAFAGLLDIGTETPPPPQDRPSPRADRTDDVRDTKRPDSGRRDDEPARPANNAADEPQDQTKATPARQENQTGTATASKDAASAGTAKADEKTATDADTSAKTDGEANADATVAVAAATADTLAQVVTPVTISLLADQTATDTTSGSETGAIEAVTSKAASAHPAIDATFALSATPEKAVPAAPAQPTEVSDAVAEANAAIVAAAQPAQPPHLKQTGPHKAEKSTEAGDNDTTAVEAEAGDNNGQLTEAEHAEFLKSLHAANEGKARRPEHMADANSEAKTAHDPALAPVAPGNIPQQQTPTPAGLVQTTTALNGVQAVDQRGAADPAADAVVPVAGLAVEIVTRAREGKNRFEIRLDPPELGRIDVRLDIDGQGNVTSRLLVERADTLDLLRRDFNTLERALNDAGLKTDNGSLQFAMRDQGFAGGGQQQNEFSRSARVIVPGETDTITPAARYNIAQRSGIDISV
jgi:flagellar hook-length control protein FliK